MLERLKIVAVIADDALADLAQADVSAAAVVHVVADMAAALSYLRGHDDVELVLLLESGDGGETLSHTDELRRSQKAAPVPMPVPVIVLTDDPDVFDVVTALRGERVTDVVFVPWRGDELRTACERACETNRLRRELENTKKQLHRRLEIMGLMSELTVDIADAGALEQLTRVLAQGLFRIAPSGIGAALIAQGDQACLHIHCPHSTARQAPRSARDRALEIFATLTGRPLAEDRLTVDLSGGGMSLETEHEHQGVFTHVPVAVDSVTIGVIVLGTDAAIMPAVEKMMFFMAQRAAETFRRLSFQQQGERHRLGLMVEAMADGVIFYNQHTDHVLINPAARRMLDIAPIDDVPSTSLEPLLGFHPLDRVMSSARRSTQVMRQELEIGDRSLHCVVAAVDDADGAPVGAVVALRDLSEARALSRRQSEFVSLISHELRTPLTSIAGILDMMLKGHAGVLSNKQQRYLQLARESYDKLDALIRNILDLARSERNEMLDAFSLIDLNELTEQSVAEQREPAEAKNLRLRLSTEERAIRILGDGVRLAQVIQNLLSNAIKFSPHGGQIEVHVFGPSVVAEHVGMSVFNTGEPIPSEARERIFAKFEQLEDLSTRESGGAGLGLPISRAIVEAHGGRLWAESLDEGTLFVFILPVAPSTDESSDERVSERAATQSGLGESLASESSDNANISVLVVDDVQHSGVMLTGLLMAAGYQVSTVQDAESALTLARTRPPQLVVISLNHVSSANADLVDICFHDPQMRKTAMLLVSPDTRVRDVAMRANADFLATPVEPGQFLDTCAALIHEAGRASANRVLVVDDDSTIRMIARDVLEESGYEVYDVGDGAGALDAAKRFKPHVMLLDIMMPKMDGFQTAERMRADPATSMTPIIFVSAKGETADKVRAFRAGAEDYMVKPFDPEELVARVGKSVARQARELGASPTTQLPGSDAIEAEIEHRLRVGDGHAFCYLDLDNLKAFNDYYGYAKADGVIRQTGDIIRDIVAREGSPGDFIGHIAGDDFIFVTTAERVNAVCAAICSTFDRLVPLYYDRADRDRGFIEAKDRYGIVRRFPIMTVSLAVVTPARGEVERFSDLAAMAARGKKLAKALIGSSYVCDGRPILGRKH